MLECELSFVLIIIYTQRVKQNKQNFSQIYCTDGVCRVATCNQKTTLALVWIKWQQNCLRSWVLNLKWTSSANPSRDSVQIMPEVGQLFLCGWFLMWQWRMRPHVYCNFQDFSFSLLQAFFLLPLHVSWLVVQGFRWRQNTLRWYFFSPSTASRSWIRNVVVCILHWDCWLYNFDNFSVVGGCQSEQVEKTELFFLLLGNRQGLIRYRIYLILKLSWTERTAEAH